MQIGEAGPVGTAKDQLTTLNKTRIPLNSCVIICSPYNPFIFRSETTKIPHFQPHFTLPIHFFR